jgi:hypothetical protein
MVIRRNSSTAAMRRCALGEPGDESNDLFAHRRRAAQANEEGKALLKKKGSSAKIRAWLARYAGEASGSVVVSVEYPNLAALAKDEAMFSTDAELRAWLQGLGKIRKVMSDSIYEELKP